MILRSVLALAFATSSAAFLTSCAKTPSGGSGLASYQSYDVSTSLPSDPGNVRVKVSLSRQRTYVMEGPKLLMVMPVSVGTSSTPTPSGSFTIFHKDAKHRATTHGYAHSGSNVKQTYLAKKPAGWFFKGTPMPYWCEFKPDYGFHTGWIKHTPCTNGCIRMHENLAPKFFRLVEVGTPVNIAYSQPEDAIVGNIPLPPDSGPLPDYDGSMYVGDDYFNRHQSPIYN